MTPTQRCSSSAASPPSYAHIRRSGGSTDGLRLLDARTGDQLWSLGAAPSKTRGADGDAAAPAESTALGITVCSKGALLQRDGEPLALAAAGSHPAVAAAAPCYGEPASLLAAVCSVDTTLRFFDPSTGLAKGVAIPLGGLEERAGEDGGTSSSSTSISFRGVTLSPDGSRAVVYGLRQTSVSRNVRRRSFCCLR